MRWPAGQAISIPAPLWQDVEIAADDISIAQAADGGDWVLGQGSYGMVSVVFAQHIKDLPAIAQLAPNQLACMHGLMLMPRAKGHKDQRGPLSAA